MSHFTVLAITDKPEDLESVLQPFHEYECTGTNDEYVVFVPSEETKEELEAKHKKDLKEYPDCTKEDFGQFLMEDYGYEMREGIYGRETNPNAKWDWWQIGGRWSGYLKLKDKGIGKKGESGLMGSEFDSKGVDQCVKSDADFDSRMKDAANTAEKEYDEAHAIIDSRDYQTWGECRESFKLIDDAREHYNNQSVIEDLKKKYDHFRADLDKYKTDRESFIKTAANSAISTFAVIKDGKWYERGDMGWWGCVSDEKGKDDWNGEFKDLLDAVPDDKWLTVVDCHI